MLLDAPNETLPVLQIYGLNSALTNNYRPQTKLREGYVFTAVCDSVHRGVCLSACWDTTPLNQAPPGADTPQSRHPHEAPHPPGSRHTPLRGAGTNPPPPEQTLPLHCACWEIRPTSGRYASYWNAILLGSDIVSVKSCKMITSPTDRRTELKANTTLICRRTEVQVRLAGLWKSI